MSGFITIIHRKGQPIAPATIGRMMGRLAHRGPDGQKTRHIAEAGMGHLLLKTGKGSQNEEMPASSADGRFWLTGDLRLDDREELWDELGGAGPFDPMLPDSQLVLRAYEKWGEACPEHLLGDFAFVIWDSRLKQVFAARDPFGIKPFYYHLSDQMFAAASEIKALLAIPGLDKAIDETWLVDYLAVIPIEAEPTIYRSIRRLPQANRLVVGRESHATTCYWQLDPTKKLDYADDAEYVEAFRELFFKAVRRRMPEDLPVGSFLSGGIDSSSITCVARHLLQERGGGDLHTYSAVFPATPETDESRYIASVVDGGGVVPHYFNASSSGPLTYLDPMMACLDEPRHAYNLYLNWDLLGQANRAGTRVMLDGYDGDSTLSHGDGLFVEWARRGQWLKLLLEMRPYQRMRAQALWPHYWKTLLQYGIRANLPRWVQDSLHRLRKPRGGTGQERSGGAATKEKHRLFKDSLVADVQPAERQRRMVRPVTLGHMQRHLEKLQNHMIPNTAEVLDAIAAPQGIEMRYPFFDRELAEFCLALPKRFKLKAGYSRAVIREALVGVLPDAIRLRHDKANMSPGYLRNISEYDRSVIESNGVWAGGFDDYLDKRVMSRLLEKFKESTCSEEELMLINRLVCLGAWDKAAGGTDDASIAGNSQYICAS